MARRMPVSVAACTMPERPLLPASTTLVTPEASNAAKTGRRTAWVASGGMPLDVILATIAMTSAGGAPPPKNDGPRARW